MKQANCLNKAPKNHDEKDPWFPVKGQSTTEGKIACFTCPVRAECRNYQKRTNSKHGIWGGVVGG